MQIKNHENHAASKMIKDKAQELSDHSQMINQKLGEGRIIIIRSSFNQEIELIQQAHAQRFFQAVNYNVPVYIAGGSLELPWLAQEVYLKYKPSVILAIGAIIKGESHHFEMVCQQSLAGLMQVSLKHHIPIIQGILTTYNIEQCTKRLELAYQQAMQAYELAYSLLKTSEIF